MSSPDNTDQFHPGEEFWSHPKGLNICFYTEMMFWIGIISAAIAFAFVPLVGKWMHGVN